MLIALASGILAFLIVPFLLPFETSGTLTEADAAGPNAQFVTLNGLSVHVETADYTGDDENPPLVVLLHGFGASTFSWRDVIEPLAVLGDVIAYDRPAFGFTERPTAWSGDDPYGSPANLALLDALLAEFAPGDREVILVGHSAGGQLATQYVETRPGAVDRLVLASPAIYTGGGVPPWLAPVLGVPQIDRLGPLAVGALASAGDELLRQSFVDQSLITDAVLEGYHRPFSVAGWEQAFWRFTRAPKGDDPVAGLGTLELPVLLITGDTDTVVPTADTERLAEELPDAELVVIPRSGHLAHEEKADAWVSAVLDWAGRTAP